LKEDHLRILIILPVAHPRRRSCYSTNLLPSSPQSTHSSGIRGPVSLQMAGTTLAPSTLCISYIPAPHPQPSIWASYHLTATHDREISLLSRILGTEALKLDLQRAHSLKCSVLASPTIWAPEMRQSKSNRDKDFSNHYLSRTLPDTANRNP